MMPNILFLIIDSLRSDKFPLETQHSNCPNILSLKKNGTLFSNTISSANATILSWSSIFTSQFPFKTGIRSARFNKLNQDITTSFDILKNNGYNIYGYLPKLSETIGLFPKFQNEDYLYDFYGGLSNGLAEKTIEKINSSLKSPWFFLLHSMDLHQPINVSKEFDTDEFGNNSYEKKISEIDHYIGTILKKIDLTKTILILTSDHGDYIKSTEISEQNLDFNQNSTRDQFVHKISKHTPNFLKPVKDQAFLAIEKRNQERKLKQLQNLNLQDYEKRALIAGKADKDHFLFDELIKVPFLLAGPNIPEDLLITQQIRSVDIFPTIFNSLNIKFSSDIDGINLSPLLDGMEFPESPAYIESNPLVLTNSNDVIGIRTSKFKYFRDKDDATKRVHLFDLTVDPYEENNISSDEKLVQKCENILISIVKDFSSNNSENAPESDEIEQELRKLGYV
jgi:arylsulfatase A-like enzyme